MAAVGGGGEGRLHSLALTTAIRVHRKEAAKPMDLGGLRECVAGAVQYSKRVAVAVDGHDGALRDEVAACLGHFPSAVVVEVGDWGAFVPALNKLVVDARQAGSKAILFQSTEVRVAAEGVQALAHHLDETTLVVGAALPGHAFVPAPAPTPAPAPAPAPAPSQRALSGLTSPWNTLAMWDVGKLSRTGFLLVSEGTLGEGQGGMEEPAVIALHQLVSPSACRAKLVGLPGVEWHTAFADPARADWHRRKMESKESRAALQLRALGVRGVVEHIAM